jgi:hypothetical protein
MVARGEAVGGEEAERLEAERSAARAAQGDGSGLTNDGALANQDGPTNDDELTRSRG